MQNQPGRGKGIMDDKLTSPAASLQSCLGLSAVSSLQRTSDFFQCPGNPNPVPMASDNDELSTYGQWQHTLNFHFECSMCLDS